MPSRVGKCSRVCVCVIQLHALYIATVVYVSAHSVCVYCVRTTSTVFCITLTSGCYQLNKVVAKTAPGFSKGE